MAELFHVEGLKKSFVEGDREIIVLQGLDLVIQEGEGLAIVGESGAGKSTLLHILGSLDRPDGGQILYLGRNLSSLGDEELSQLRNREVGFIFQFHYLLPDFSALENIMLPALIGGWAWEKARAAAMGLLDEVGLRARASHKPGKLSGGEQQRVAVARALVLEPKVLLADEPTGDLDPHTADEIEKLLFRLNKERRIALVVATHNWPFAQQFERTMELKKGRLFPREL